MGGNLSLLNKAKKSGRGRGNVTGRGSFDVFSGEKIQWNLVFRLEKHGQICALKASKQDNVRVAKSRKEVWKRGGAWLFPLCFVLASQNRQVALLSLRRLISSTSSFLSLSLSSSHPRFSISERREREKRRYLFPSSLSPRRV